MFDFETSNGFGLTVGVATVSHPLNYSIGQTEQSLGWTSAGEILFGGEVLCAHEVLKFSEGDTVQMYLRRADKQLRLGVKGRQGFAVTHKFLSGKYHL